MASNGVIEVLFLLAPLVLVPLALKLLTPPEVFPFRWLARWGPPLAGAAVAASFLVPRGGLAAALALPWLALVLTAVPAALGMLWSRGFSDVVAAARSVGLLFLPVGAGWLVLSRLGAQPLGFVDPIVLLTAVHFHFAGFLTLSLMAVTAGVLRDAWPRLSRASVLGAVVGTPLLAAGITFSPGLELLGATTLAAALTVFSIVLLAAARRLASALLALSACCFLLGMTLAVVYAVGEFAGRGFLSIARMAQFHGVANALGSLFGLVGWAVGDAGRERSKRPIISAPCVVGSA
jgi:hypothetical protein